VAGALAHVGGDVIIKGTVSEMTGLKKEAIDAVLLEKAGGKKREGGERDSF